MWIKIVFSAFLFFVLTVYSHPTVYKLNANYKLEPDLVPVSSTVIPLPIYQVSYGIDIVKGLKEQKSVVQKPEGPVTLITAHTKKKAIPVENLKKTTGSSVKEVGSDTFENQ